MHTATLNDCCTELAKIRDMNPITTFVQIIFCGHLISRPDQLSRNIFDVADENEFAKHACVHALTISLSEEECKELCDLFETHKFPKFERQNTNEKTIEFIRLLLWSECDRLLRRRPGAGSKELGEQLRSLNAIINQPTIADNVKGFLSGLADLAGAAYNIYASSAAATYDELIKLLKPVVQQGITLADEDSSTIELQIGEKTHKIEKARLTAMSSYFSTLINGVKINQATTATFKEAKDEVGTIELEEHSLHLFEYLDKDKGLDL